MSFFFHIYGLYAPGFDPPSGPKRPVVRTGAGRYALGMAGAEPTLLDAMEAIAATKAIDRANGFVHAFDIRLADPRLN